MRAAAAGRRRGGGSAGKMAAAMTHESEDAVRLLSADELAPYAGNLPADVRAQVPAEMLADESSGPLLRNYLAVTSGRAGGD